MWNAQSQLDYIHKVISTNLKWYSRVDLPNQKMKVVITKHWNLRAYLSKIWEHSSLRFLVCKECFHILFRYVLTFQFFVSTIFHFWLLYYTTISYNRMNIIVQLRFWVSHLLLNTQWVAVSLKCTLSYLFLSPSAAQSSIL